MKLHRPLRSALLPALLALAAFAVAEDPTRMRAHFIDVGQGSATLLEFECGAVLIDTGAADDTNADSLHAYLEAFFKLRPDLNRTLQTVFLTHCHADHAYGLEGVFRDYTVLHYVDDGVRSGSGKRFTDRMLAWIKDHPGPTVEEAFDKRVREVGGLAGLTDDAIDALRSDACDPDVRVLSGGYEADDKPADWGKTAFENLNNHSLVVRASLGKASVLITGDLETEGIKRLVARYRAGGLLKSEILVAGHHGAENGIGPEFLGLVSPEIGIISCGHWDDGMTAKDKFNTYNYGHPRKATVSLLAAGLTRRRRARNIPVGTGARTFENLKLDKAVYGTAWDGSIVVDAYADGRLVVADHGLVSTRAPEKPLPKAPKTG